MTTGIFGAKYISRVVFCNSQHHFHPETLAEIDRGIGAGQTPVISGYAF